MMRYVLAAATLKLLSSSSPTRKLYRSLANTFGTRRRLKSDIPGYYVERVKRMLDLAKRHRVIRNGDRLIELGTGWVHWEATSIRLFYDVEAILFDVWDNRQFRALKRYFAELDRLIDGELEGATSERVHSLIEAILSTSSFDELYRLLGFNYVVEPRGRLDGLGSQSVDVVVSAGVLEHVKREQLSDYTRDCCRLLRPGGYSIHSINIADHLSAYDRTVSAKNYLRFSDEVWKFCFENEIQYFNRVQRSEWLRLFSDAGMELVDEESTHGSIGAIKIHRKYREYGSQDLDCVYLRIVHRKPVHA